MEALEDRLAPATYIWNGPNAGLWSVAANWNDLNGNAYANPPGQNDDLVFNATANTDSQADIATIHGLRLDDGYNHTVNLDPLPQNTLTISGSLSIKSGTLFATLNQALGIVQRELLLSTNATTGLWTGGTLKGIGVEVGDITNNIRPTFTIGGNAPKYLDQSDIHIAGTTVFQESPTGIGDLLCSRESLITIQNGGTFDIRTNGRIAETNLQAPQFSKLLVEAGGSLKKTAGAATTYVAVDFQNSGNVQLSSGSVLLLYNAVQAAGQTWLAGGALITGTSYMLNGGTFFSSGSGSFQGNLLNNAGTVIITKGAGISILGNYFQGLNGTLVCNISDQGQYATLSVSGNATLSGTLTVNNGAYAPNNTVPPLTILSFGSRTGNFGTINYQNPLWLSFGVLYEFDEILNTTNIRLMVVAA